MTEPSKNSERTRWATIEHLNHLPPWNNPETVVICCQQCNSSRGNRTLPMWFTMPYCVRRNISEHTVTEPVINYLQFGKTLTIFD